MSWAFITLYLVSSDNEEKVTYGYISNMPTSYFVYQVFQMPMIVTPRNTRLYSNIENGSLKHLSGSYSWSEILILNKGTEEQITEEERHLVITQNGDVWEKYNATRQL